MKKLFWDIRLRRLSALWRIILHAIIMFIMTIPLVSLAALIASFGSGGVDTESFSDPTVMMEQLESKPGSQLILVLASGLAIVIATWLAARFLDKRKFADLGLHLNGRWWQDFGFGLALGALLMLLIFLVEYAAGWLQITSTFDSGFDGISFGAAMLGAAALFVAVGFYEELMSRGYHLKNLAEGLGFMGSRPAIVIALLLSSAVFGLLHAGNPNATFISTFNIFLAGIFLGLGYILTGELAIPIGLHITWNFFQGNVFGFPVSGNVAGPSIIRIEQGGAPLITGGAFGPEAGLIGIGAMILGLILTAFWVRRGHGTADLKLSLTEPDLTERHQLALNQSDSPQLG